MMLGAIAKMRNSIGGQVLVLVKTPRPDRRDSRLIEFLSKYENHKSLKKDEQKINGTLSHLYIQRGHSHLSNLFHWLATFPNEFTPRYPPPSVTTDLKCSSLAL
jgi:hypothetical protein